MSWVTGVELLHRVGLGHQLVELQLAVQVELGVGGDVVLGAHRSSPAPDQPALDVDEVGDRNRELDPGPRDAHRDTGATPVQDVERRAQHGGMTDALEGPVDAAFAEHPGPGQHGVDRLDRVDLGGVHEVRGPELAGKRLLARHRVDCDDPRRVRQLQCLDAVEPNASHTEHRGGLTGLHLGLVEHGADTGHDTAGEEGSRGERHLLADAHRLDLLDDGALGERRGPREVAGRLALVGERLGHVAHRAAAVEGPAGAAPLADAAVGHRRHDDVIAGRDPRHRRPDLLHDAGPFVAEHGGGRPRDRAVDDGDVAVAHTGRDQPHDDLVCAGIAHRQVVGDLDTVTQIHDPPHRSSPLVAVLRRPSRAPSQADRPPDCNSVHASTPNRSSSAAPRRSFPRTRPRMIRAWSASSGCNG